MRPHIHRRRRAVAALEYGLMIGLTIGVCYAAVSAASDSVTSIYEHILTAFQQSP